MGAQAGRFVVQLVSLLILARLLEPAVFGHLAMVMVVIGVGELIRDFGLSRAAVQSPSLSTGQRDNLFWVNTGVGVVLAAAAFVCAPLVASLYEEPVLTGVTRWLALVFVINGIGTQYRASLNRDLRFRPTALFDVLGPLLGLVVAVVIALLGGSYWALVGQQLASFATTSLGPALVAGWIPGRPRRDAPIGHLLRFGLHLLGTQGLRYVSTNVDTFVIGMRYSAGAVGLYSRAFQLMALPINQLNAPVAKVALPVLARLQDEPQRYREFLARGQVLLLTATLPVLALVWAAPGAVVDIALGPAWGGTVPILELLAVGGVFQTLGFLQNWIFTSVGRTREQLQIALVTSPIVIAAIVVGSGWGPEGVARGYSAAMALQWALSLWWAGRAVPQAGVGALLGNDVRSIIVYATAAVAGRLVVSRIDVEGSWAILGLTCAVMAAVVGLVAGVWPAFRAGLRQCAQTIRLLR